MSKNRILIAIAVIASVLVAGAISFLRPRSEKPAEFVHVDHPAKKLSFWKGVEERPLDRRLIEAPPMLIDYLTKDNVSQGWPQKPRSVKLEPDFKADLLFAIRSLPQPVLDRLQESLAFVTVVRDLGGSAYTDFLVSDEKGFSPYSFVVLDIESMNRRANEWATWKENSPFASSPATRLTAIIEEPSTDDRRHALQYIMLHEIGHVLAFNSPRYPRQWVSPTGPRHFEAGFLALSWAYDESKQRSVSLLEDQLPWRKRVAYYAPDERKVPIAEAREFYEDLRETNFPTLYATTNYNDDFADSFASYVHVVLQKKPWEIRIESEGGAEPFVYGSCWDEPRCKQKRLILESMLGL